MKMTLYERIRELRIKQGMSQDDLAKAMGYKDRSMITKIESGRVDISQKKILAFADVLNTTPGYLMGWNENTEANEEREDQDRLEALHQNPRLGLLFDRSRKMSHADVEFMLKMADRILKERDGDE
jgi:transcriptional regulator with XRE-family HTH domain